MKKFLLILLFTISASGAVFINSFNSGQLSPKMKNRIDTDKRSMGVETLENVLVRPQGLICRRNGSEYVSSMKVESQSAHFIADYYNTGYTPSSKAYWTNGSGTSVWLSQTFTASETFDISKVKLLLDTDESDGDVTVSIRDTNSGVPDGNDLCSSIVNADDWVADDDGTWYEFDFNTPTTLTEGHTYSIVLRADFTTIKWRMNLNDAYANGQVVNSSDSGLTWTAKSDDYYFETYKSGYNYEYPNKVRLIPFEYSNIDSYVLEFSHENIGFFRTANSISSRILDSNDQPYYITSPYDGNDLREIQYVQSNDVMYLVHKDYPPQKLARFDHDNWSIGGVDWQWGPFLTENTTEVTIKPSGNVTSKGIDYYTEEDLSYSIIRGTDLVAAQTFTALESYDVNQIALKLYRKGSPGSLIVSIRATNLGTPYGNDLTSGYINSNDFVTYTNGEWYYIDMNTPYSLVAGTQYAIVAKAPSANFNNTVRWRGDGYNTSATYSGGTSWSFQNNSYWEQYTNIDQTFKIYNTSQSNETFIASGDIFDPNHVGSIWKLTQKTTDNDLTGTLNEDDEASGSLYIFGNYLMNLKGTWNGTVILERSNDATNWITVYIANHSSSYYDDIDYSGKESEEGYSYRVIFDDWTSGAVEFNLVAYNNYISGYARITGYVDANEVTINVIEPFANANATTKWSEGAWSDFRGYPRAICFYQNRLCLAGTYYQPNTLWCSKSSDYENMRVTGLDDGAIDYTVSSAKQNPIMWLQDAKSLVAGTSGSIITIGSQSATSTLTAASIGSQRQTETGSGSIQAALTGNSIIYVDRNYKKIRDISYNVQSDGLVSTDLTIFSDNITEPNILEMAWQSRPDNIGWFVKGDGNMVTLTYNPSEGVSALSEISTDGNYVSVCVIPGKDEDEVWVAVERDSNDSIFIEKFHNQDWTSDVWFVDSGLEYDGNETSILTGAGHLEGKSVQVYTDANGYIGDFTVSDSNIVLDVNVTQAIAGLGYKSIIKTFPIEVGYDGGTSIGVRKNIRRIVLGLYESGGGRYGFDNMYDILYPPYTTDFYTGITTRLNFMSGYKDEVFIVIDQNEPLPLGLTSISLVDFEVGNAN